MVDILLAAFVGLGLGAVAWCLLILFLWWIDVPETAAPPVTGPLDALVRAEVRALLTTATEPDRLAASLVAACGWSPATAAEVAAGLSVKLRAALLPLVE